MMPPGEYLSPLSKGGIHPTCQPAQAKTASQIIREEPKKRASLLLYNFNTSAS
jgi:hypothetical protein